MKNTKSKGFTIVELVIVIAVIAILAAVLIPTFASLVKKANVSADEQAVKQMNTALAIYTAENGTPDSIYKVREALSENDINADTLVPVTQGYAFYWDNANNKIVLVGEGKETAKSGWALLTSTGYGEAPNTPVTDVASLQSAIEQSKNSGTPVLVKLEQNLTVPSNTQGNNNGAWGTAGVFCVGNGETLIIDANGHTITSEVSFNLFRVDDGGQLVVKNATFETKHCAFLNVNSTLRLENVTINNTGENACIHFDGLCDTYIANSKISNSGGFGIATNSSKDESDGARLTLVNTDVTTTKDGYAAINVTIYTNVSIEGGTISGKQHGAYFRGCNATIKNATFKHSQTVNDPWKTGNWGPDADIVFACGGTREKTDPNGGDYTGYITTANYTCENVTASKIIVHEPEGGTVNVSGIDADGYHKCTKEYGETCTGND